MYRFVEFISSPHMGENKQKPLPPQHAHTHTHTPKKKSLSVFWLPYLKGFREEDTGGHTH